MNGLAWKLMGTGSAVLAGIAVRKVLGIVWEAGTGGPPPANPADRQTSFGQAAAFSLASGALVGLARMMAARKAAEYYERSSGHLPPNLHKVH